MGSQIIDIILFAAVAGFFGFQLWRVLGRRTGTERPPRVLDRTVAPSNVVPLPIATPLTATTVPPRDPVKAGLDAIALADPKFRPRDFVGGARHAFEMIVHAFAEGDTATLRPLVSDEVYDTFAEAVRQRLAQKETVETRIVRQDDPEITEAHLDGRTAFVTLKIQTAQISVTRAADGSVLEGDPEQPHERTDFWTFSRNTRATDPNWILVGTTAPE